MKTSRPFCAIGALLSSGASDSGGTIRIGSGGHRADGGHIYTVDRFTDSNDRRGDREDPGGESMRSGSILAIVFYLGWLALAAGALIGCQTNNSPQINELYLINTLAGGDLLPIVEDNPPDPGDIREMRNCSEQKFTPPRRGPWVGIENKELAADAEVVHRTSDRVVRVGDPLSLSAEITYDDEPLSGDWVRLFVGTCGGWNQIADRKTDPRGRAQFQIRNRLPVGVYGVVFQVVGDGSVSRAELWVLPRETKIIGMELMGGAFDELDDSATVAGAATLASWYTNQGHLVTYVDLEPSNKYRVDQLRGMLRKEGFPVGPVIRVSSGKDSPSLGEVGWGEATASRQGTTEFAVSRFYGGDARVEWRLHQSAVRATEVLSRERFCQSLVEDKSCGGWVQYLTEIMPESGEEEPQPPPNF